MLLAFVLFACVFGSGRNLANWVPWSEEEIALVTIECVEELRGFHDNGILHPYLTGEDFTYGSLPIHVIMGTNSPFVETHTGIQHLVNHNRETWKRIFAELENVVRIVQAAVVRSPIAEPPELRLALMRLRTAGEDVHDLLVSIVNRLIHSQVPWRSNSVVDAFAMDEFLRELTQTEIEVCTTNSPIRSLPMILHTNGNRYMRLAFSHKAIRLFSNDQIVFSSRKSEFEANKERLILRRLGAVPGVAKLANVSSSVAGVVAVTGNKTDVPFIRWRCFTEEFLTHMTVQALKILWDIHNQGFVYGLIEATSFVITREGDIRFVNFENASTWLDPRNEHTRRSDLIELITFVSEVELNSRMSEFHPACTRPQASWSRHLSDTLHKILDELVLSTWAQEDPKYDKWIDMLENI